MSKHKSDKSHHTWIPLCSGDEGLYPPKSKLLCLWNYETIRRAITKFDWQLGRYEPSSPSTKELHDRSVPRYLEQLQKHPKAKKIKKKLTTSVTRFGEISPLWQKLKVFGKFLISYFQILSLLWQNCDIIGLVFIVANGQILQNNLTIWPHCWRFLFFPDRSNERRSIGCNYLEINFLSNF